MWANWVFDHRFSVLSLTIALVVFSAFGLPKLSFTADTRVFFDAADKRFTDLQDFEATFLPSHTIVFAIEATLPLHENPTARDAIRWLHQAVSGIRNAIRIDSLHNVSYPHNESGEVHIQSYLDYVCPADCIESRVQALHEPLIARKLISRDLTVFSVVGTFELNLTEAKKIAQISAAAYDLEKEFESKFPTLKLHVTGGIPMSQAFVDAGQKDSSLTFAAAAFLILILLWGVLGSLRNAGIMLLTGACAVIVCMGIGGWVGIELNSASASVPIVVLTLVVATTMHIFSHFLRMSEDPRGPAFAATRTLNVNLVPVALTTATSVLSLASLMLVNSPPVKDIGLLSAIGVFAGGVFAITLTPLLLDTTKKIREPYFHYFAQSVLNRYADKLETLRVTQVLLVFLLASSAFGVFHLNVDDDFVGYFSENLSFRKATDFNSNHLVGPNHIEIDLNTRNGNSLFDPSTLDEISQLTALLREDPLAASVSSITDVQSLILRAFDEPRSLIEIEENAHHQYFLSYELSLQPGESTGQLVNVDKTRTHVSVFLNHSTAKQIQALENRVLGWSKNFHTLDVTVTGENIPVAHLSSSNIPAVVEAIAITLIATALIICLVFRNWRIGFNSLIAITFPVLCGFGLWGWLVGSIGLAGTVVLAISIGVVIDDAIHLIYHQLRAVQNGQERWEATRTSIHRVGVPILATTLIFVVGLIPLVFSDFSLNTTLATCTAIIILYSLIFDLGILPRLLAWSVPPERTDQNAAE